MSEPTATSIISLDAHQVEALEGIRQRIKLSPTPEKTAADIHSQLVSSMTGSTLGEPSDSAIDEEAARLLADLTMRLVVAMDEAGAESAVDGDR